MSIPRARVFTVILTWATGAFALFWMLGALSVMVNFGLGYIAFDQYHFYPKYLTVPFPDSVLQNENGHRPVLPAMVRVAELAWFGADQSLQRLLGGLAAFATVAIVAWSTRQASPATGERAPGLHVMLACLIGTLGVLWLGSARMLIHGNEVTHVYFITAFTALALVATHAARRSRALAWMTLASLLATAATFSFGAGMAAFAAVLVTAVLLRLPSRAVLLTLACAGIVGYAYLGGMPGDDGVRGSLLFDPLAGLSVGLRWLAAPWMHAWLGLADPPLIDWAQREARGSIPGNVLLATAQAGASLVGDRWPERAALMVGALGAVAGAAMLAHAARRGRNLSRGQVVAAGMAALSVAVGAIICLARMRHFQSVPHDIVAERYLPWSALFWMGLALYLVASLDPSRRARTAGIAVAALVVAALVLPSQAWWAGWSAAVHRNNQLSAVAAQMGIRDAALFPDGPDASYDDVTMSLELLEERGASMFSEAEYTLWRDHAPLAGDMPAAEPVMHGRRVREARDTRGDRDMVVFEGYLPEDIPADPAPVIAIYDTDGALAGLAKTSFSTRDAMSWRWHGKRGFDGYVPADAARKPLVIAFLRRDTLEPLAKTAFEISP
ncbi:hypothetical protein ACQQ2N_13655 [Dokdonella sp. MW10]|uniref:hypothetical protein n=1 Tax=Dokdonella sp. MW10 TaxID=2992926 RepID=UPI003F7E44B3